MVTPTAGMPMDALGWQPGLGKDIKLQVTARAFFEHRMFVESQPKSFHSFLEGEKVVAPSKFRKSHLSKRIDDALFDLVSDDVSDDRSDIEFEKSLGISKDDETEFCLENSVKESELCLETSVEISKKTDFEVSNSIVCHLVDNDVIDTNTNTMNNSNMQALNAYSEKIVRDLLNDLVDISIDSSGGGAWMPSFNVKKIESTTTKNRPVVNASRRYKQPDGKMKSLNDCIYDCTVNIKDVSNALMRFRLHQVSLTGDVKKMFLQCATEKLDQPMMTFYWPESEFLNLKCTFLVKRILPSLPLK